MPTIFAVGFAGNPLDRLSQRRDDASRLRGTGWRARRPRDRFRAGHAGAARWRERRCRPCTASMQARSFGRGARGGFAWARRKGPGLRLAAARRRRLRRGAADAAAFIDQRRLMLPAWPGPADPRPARAGQQAGACPAADRDARAGQSDPALSCGPSLLRPLRRADPRRRTAAGGATARPAAPCISPHRSGGDHDG